MRGLLVFDFSPASMHASLAGLDACFAVMLSDLTTRPTLSVRASRLIVDAAVAGAMSVPVTVVAVTSRACSRSWCGWTGRHW
jgi:hypothetical protein